MVKSRVITKKKENSSGIRGTVMLDLDADVVDALEDIAKLADVTPSQVINVMLATKVYNEKAYQEDRLKSKTKKSAVKKGIPDYRHVRDPYHSKNVSIGLGGK